jgi:transcriptional regulator of acetoin/glycerol metabolism
MFHNNPSAFAQANSTLLLSNLPANIDQTPVVILSSADRARLRKERNTAAKLARRAALGAAPHALSAERMKPWLDLGISRSTFYREKKAAALRRLSQVAS